jgi:uncharacterized protein YggE
MSDTQSIQSPWGASVFGAASVDAVPDLARLRLAIRQTWLNPAEAFAVTRGAVNRVREVLRKYGIPDSAVSASQPNLKSVWSYAGNERKFAGYECFVAFVIEVRDLDLLETILIDATEAGANQVDGIEFDVSGKKKLRALAREAAVAAARDKAELYARAAGVRLGPAIHIKDIDSDLLQNPYRSHNEAAMGADEGDLAPGKVTVSAGVVVGFSLMTA